MHENEATTHEAENKAEASNYEAKNEVNAVKCGLEALTSLAANIHHGTLLCQLTVQYQQCSAVSVGVHYQQQCTISSSASIVRGSRVGHTSSLLILASSSGPGVPVNCIVFFN